MANAYSDGKYGVITRKYFGLTKKWGGDNAAGYTFATAHGTSIVHLARWYPKGPCKLVKAGSFVLATLANASSDLHLARIRGRSGSASVMATWNIKNTSTQKLQAVFASIDFTSTKFPITHVKAGEYVSIMTATPTTDKATRVQATTTGTIAFFVDVVANYDSSRWDVPSKE